MRLRSSVVLPLPGAPHRSTDCGRAQSVSRRRSAMPSGWRAMRRFREDGSRRAVIVPFCTTAVPQMPRRCPPGSVTKPQRVISCMA